MERRTYRLRHAWTVVAVTAALVAQLVVTTGVRAPGAALAAVACPDMATKLAALGLSSSSTVSTDGVPYTMWSGHVASWDGLPLAVDVSVPAGGACGLPTVAMNHWIGGSRQSWETADSTSTILWGQRWNNVWLVSQGYAVLTFTQRGFFDSCGPTASTDSTVAGLPAACTANNKHYWVDSDDARYSLRDMQWLLGRLVDAGLADAHRLGVTGASLGAGLTNLAAVANDRIMCGGISWDVANGTDPCVASPDGTLVPWRSPAGVPLGIAAAIPEAGWSDLANALAPNGQVADANGVTPLAPVGIPKAAWAANLLNTVSWSGFAEPATAEPSTWWATWLWTLTLPIDTQNVVTTWAGQYAVQGLANMQRYHSANSTLLSVDAKVPVLFAQGFSDSLFNAGEAQSLTAKLKRFAPDYPVAGVVGDLGHSPASNTPDVWSLISVRNNAFLDFYLKGKGAPPELTTTAVPVRCADGATGVADPLSSYTSADLSTQKVGSTDLAVVLPSRANTTTGTTSVPENAVPSAQDTSTCPHAPVVTAPAKVPFGQWTLSQTTVVAGTPSVTLATRSSTLDAQLDVTLAAITPATGQQWVIAKGDYRVSHASPTTDAQVVVPLSPTLWRLPAGTVLRVEVAGADAPRALPAQAATVTTVDKITLHLTTAEAASAASAQDTTGQANVAKSFTVVSFASPSPASAYSATVDWGDGTSSNAAAVSLGAGRLGIRATHAYSSAGAFSVKTGIRSASAITSVLTTAVTVS